MPRLIEIFLFVLPFLGFAAWRLLFPSPVPPLWLVCVLAGCVVITLAALLWVRNLDAGDARKPYVPARMENGRIIGAPPPQPP